MDELLAKHISKSPDVCGGKACISGHRIRVIDIVVWNQFRGYSPDEIVNMFPGISLGDVHAALAYYFDNYQDIQNELATDDSAAQELLTGRPSKVEGKLSA